MLKARSQQELHLPGEPAAFLNTGRMIYLWGKGHADIVLSFLQLRLPDLTKLDCKQHWKESANENMFHSRLDRLVTCVSCVGVACVEGVSKVCHKKPHWRKQCVYWHLHISHHPRNVPARKVACNLSIRAGRSLS